MIEVPEYFQDDEVIAGYAGEVTEGDDGTVELLTVALLGVGPKRGIAVRCTLSVDEARELTDQLLSCI